MKSLKKFIKEVIKYKEYVKYSVKADIRTGAANTYLGYLWWLLDPLMYMAVYVLVVSLIFDRGGKDFPIFVFSALLIWKWVSQTLVRNTASIRSYASITSQVYLPKALIPLIQNMVGSIYYFFGLLVLLLLMPVFSVHYSLYLIQIPVVLIVTFIFVLAVGINLAHLGVYFKDINNIMAFTIRLWFYLSPAIYSLDSIPKQIRWLWWFNPMTTIYGSMRNAIVYQDYILYKELLILTILSIILLIKGLQRIQKYDRSYTKFS